MHYWQLCNKNCGYTEPFEQIGRTHFTYVENIITSEFWPRQGRKRCHTKRVPWTIVFAPLSDLVKIACWHVHTPECSATGKTGLTAAHLAAFYGAQTTSIRVCLGLTAPLEGHLVGRSWSVWDREEEEKFGDSICRLARFLGLGHMCRYSYTANATLREFQCHRCPYSGKPLLILNN